jgi:2'-5' RNA ligase
MASDSSRNLATFSAPVRAFVALRMSPATTDAIAALIDRVRPLAGWARFVPRANLHLTLRFLGDRADPARLARLGDQLAEIAARQSPFVIEARGAGAFPNLARPKVLWIGLSGDALTGLARRVESAAVSAGFAAERRPYASHLTIGRMRDLKGWDAARKVFVELAETSFGATVVDAMMLYRSVLGPQAATYQELARYPFGGELSTPR